MRVQRARDVLERLWPRVDVFRGAGVEERGDGVEGKLVGLGEREVALGGREHELFSAFVPVGWQNQSTFGVADDGDDLHGV